MAKPDPHHSEAQRRAQGTNEFRSNYTIERLYLAVAAVARDVRPDDPEKLTQVEFNDNCEPVMAALGEPPPPKANAIYGRINGGLPKAKRKTWAKIVLDALAANGDVVRLVTVVNREEPAWFQDEGYLVYSLRRVCEHLGIELGAEAPRVGAYDRAFRELLKADSKLSRGKILADLLLSSDQIKTMAGDAGWAGACELAIFLPPGQVQIITGFDPLQMLAHFYETQRALPKTYEELRRHSATMDIPLPAAKKVSFGELKERFVAQRKLAGKGTLPDGPHPDDAMTPEQIAKLLDGAPQVRRKGYWLVLENTLDALAEYVERYESEVPLRQKHYLSVNSENDWPAPSNVTSCAKLHGIGVGEGDSPFRSMLDLARKRAREKRLAA